MSSLIFHGDTLHLPMHFTKIIHEVELGVLIGMPGRDIPQHKAHQHIGGYFLAIDFTNRDLGPMFKKDGAPWCL
jgi:acylpyruvate hydrolase